MEPVLFAIGTFISTTLGGLFGIRNHDRLHLIMSFTAGVVVAVSFFDILPEAIRLTLASGGAIGTVFAATVIGFLTFHILEKTAVIHHSHEEFYAEHGHPQVGLVGAAGLSFHSFLDGVGIGLGFHVGTHVGLIISLAVIAHDFSDGLNTVTFMLTHGNTKAKAFSMLLVDALAPVLGVFITFLHPIAETALAPYLGFFAGFLLYIGASDLLPEAHSHESSYRMISLTIVGVLFIYIVSRFS